MQPSTSNGTGAIVRTTGAKLTTPDIGAATATSITTAALSVTALSNGKIPYHVSDASGFADGPTKTDVDDAVTKKHAQQHAITSTSDHTSTATAGQILKADANGLPVDATNTDTDVASAVSLKHAALTIDGTSPLSLSGQAISLKNDAAAAITEVDTGALAASDTKIPTSAAVKTVTDLLAPKASPTFTGTVTAGDFSGINADTRLKSRSGQTIAYNSAGGPQVYAVDSGAAMLSFHRPGAYAVNFGLDTDNALKVGGWSMGAVARRIIYDELGQIKFPATQNASSNANTLDDYEEGTWTPSFLSTDCSWTYTGRGGTYTKVGRFVHCTFNIIASGGPTGTTTNTLYLSGLPYTVNGSSVSGYCALFMGLPQYPLLVQDSGYSYVQMRKLSNGAQMTGADATPGYFYGVVTFLMAT